jgi:hypothetical protein
MVKHKPISAEEHDRAPRLHRSIFFLGDAGAPHSAFCHFS